MKKLQNDPFVFIFFEVVFLAALLFGIFFGPEHPNIFFFSIMGVFAGVIAVYVAPTTKDVVLLAGGMILLAIFGTISDMIVPKSWNWILRLVIQCVFTAPIYIPTALHFVRMVIKGYRKNQETPETKK